VEAGERILPAMPPDLSARAREQLLELGVEIRERTRVVEIDDGGLTTATDPAAVTDAYRTGLLIAACCAATAAPIAFFGLVRTCDVRRSARRSYCPVDGPPVQPAPTHDELVSRS